MSKGKCTFKQSDFSRAIRGAENAGIKVGRVEVDKAGKITIIPDAISDDQKTDPEIVL
jgi:hypothetical protein